MAKADRGGKGKKCPGGYWIPKNKRCRGERRLSSPGGDRSGSGFVKTGLAVGLGAAAIGAAATAGIALASRSRKSREKVDLDEALKHTDPGVAETVRRARKRSQEGGVEPLNPNRATEGPARPSVDERFNRIRDRIKSGAANPDTPGPEEQARRQAVRRDPVYSKQESSVRGEFGLEDKPTKAEVKRARREAARKYHPDLNPNNPEAVRKLQRINEVLDLWEKEAEERGDSGNLFVDMYPRWDSAVGCWG